jgi:hypothetical protein
MSQYVGDLEHAGDLPVYETTSAGGPGWRVGGAQLAAYRSCARQLGVDVELVMRAAGTNKLGALIQVRKGSGRQAERRDLRGHLAWRDVLYRRATLMAKQVPVWT